MIIINDTNSGLSCTCVGKLSRQPSKRGYSEIESIRGQVFTEKVRSVINLNLTIDEMSEEDYFTLEKMFISDNMSLDIEDVDRGVEYSNYFIKGDSIQLEENENYDTKEYYYAGSLVLAKR